MQDVIVVGGGPAGLSAGLILGRSKRRVLVCDAGEPRNAVSNAVHGFFSRDGIHPSELRRIGREELRSYGVELREAKVLKVIRQDDGFAVEFGDEQTLRCRKLLLALGVVDSLPDVEGFARLWGSSVFGCPYCHGWEVREKPLAVYGNPSHPLDLAFLLTAWTSDLVLCTDGPAQLSTEDRQRLSANRIALVERKIVRLIGGDGQLEAIEFENGSVLPRRAVFLRTTRLYREGLPRALGCTLAESGAIVIDSKYRTTVPGVDAAGDCTEAPGQALNMAAEGARAAFAINRDLVDDDLVR